MKMCHKQRNQMYDNISNQVHDNIADVGVA